MIARIFDAARALTAPLFDARRITPDDTDCGLDTPDEAGAQFLYFAAEIEEVEHAG